ncbi:hypothetical protein LMH87_010049 [Akanthomyces muscarius]|uniref:Uncharacterized protein n=1 Tax=Akanthomyces muscarius TaxID=2231603 RepID=A0A9W8UMU2_AKAMU|nr:hypothetical protein LMH87_010049 [Akanthomyces muscarius]KAJ4153566.1 hypothetical protein LMH87_010049 [Akanthomyces muscarius]
MDAAHRTQDSKQPLQHVPKLLPENPRRRMSRTHCLLAPRPYEDIYHERAYLTTYLQQKTRRIEGLIKEYSQTQAELQAGAEGKTRRRLRKLLNLLRCKLDEASEQERAIFSRLGELYMELNSRDTWERARKPQPSIQEDGSQVGLVGESPTTSVTPVTPCPSFASSDWSVASSAALASPVLAPDPTFADAAQVHEYHDLYTLPRCLASEYLETVPEELESAVKTPPALREPTEDDGSPPMTPPPWQGLNREPEFGTLEYEYEQYESLENDEGRRSADDGTSGSLPLKSLAKRPSLPVMQFFWPDV